jgi:type II secretory pathway component PulF
MRIKATSWILAALYAAFGVAFFRIIPSFQRAYDGFEVNLPLPTRVVLCLGPIGWLVVFWLTAVFIVLKDRGSAGRWWNLCFAVLLIAIVGGAVLALFFPIFQLHEGPRA